MTRIVVVFLVVVSAAVILTGLLITSQNPTAGELGKELGKLTGQVVLVTVVGGVILQEYNRRRDL